MCKLLFPPSCHLSLRVCTFCVVYGKSWHSFKEMEKLNLCVGKTTLVAVRGMNWKDMRPVQEQQKVISVIFQARKDNSGAEVEQMKQMCELFEVNNQHRDALYGR